MRKIGELKGKPIIEGNPNEIKKNQIHYKESDGNITLSERKNDNTLSSVTSGSGSGNGSGEGVKEYYYKIKNSYVQQGLVIGLGMCHVNAIIHNYDYLGAFIEVAQTLNVANDVISFVDHNQLMFRAFRYIDIEVFTLEYSNNIPIIRKTGLGNLNERLYNFLMNNENGTDEESYNQIKQVFDVTFEEITKEEYESMITYKPE